MGEGRDGVPTIQVCLPQSLTHLLWAQLDTHVVQGSFHAAHVYSACRAGAEQFEDILEGWWGGGWRAEGEGSKVNHTHRYTEILPG